MIKGGLPKLIIYYSGGSGMSRLSRILLGIVVYIQVLNSLRIAKTGFINKFITFFKNT